MDRAIYYLVCAVLVGAGATAIMDIWMIVRRSLFGMALPDYGLVGRWLAHMTRGRFGHDRISSSPPIPHEPAIGWSAHYLIGVGFAAILLAAWGVDWVRHPTIAPALVVGIGGVAAPFLVMQPGMGAGIAGSRTPRPAATRFHSLVTHAIFGLGLYAAGWATSALLRFSST